MIGDSVEAFDSDGKSDLQCWEVEGLNGDGEPGGDITVDGGFKYKSIVNCGDDGAANALAANSLATWTKGMAWLEAKKGRKTT